MTEDFENNTWNIINNYFDNNSNYLTKHHLDSFNNFIEDKIPQTFKQYNPQIIYKEFNKETESYKYETHIYYGGKDGDQIYIAKPILYKEDDSGAEEKKQMYPNEARLRNLTYSSFIFCDILIEYHVGGGSGPANIITKTFEKINMGRIPIMLQSNLCVISGATMEMKKQMGECPYDQGGYFVVEGQEKVIVSHERKAENKLYIVASTETMFSFSAQIKSVPEESFMYARTTIVNVNASNGIITVRLPMISKQIPLFVLFKLLGVETDKDILEHILLNLDTTKAELFMEELRPSIENAAVITDKNMAIRYLANLTHGKTVSHILDNISTDLFPHLGVNYTTKAYYLGYVVNKLLEVKLGIREPTDRDSFAFKRVDLSGFLLASLFRENYKQLQRDVKIAIDSEYRFNGNEYQDDNYSKIINSANIRTIFNSKVIADAFLKAFKIGSILNKKGIIQSLNRLSSVGTVSHLRRINTLGDMIMMGQRKLHGTQYGIICPAETPDGGNIGIKKHMSILAQITFGCSSAPIIKMLFDHGVVPIEDLLPEHLFNKVKVFVNGKWIGIHEDPISLHNSIKTLRRNGRINIFTSVAFNYIDMEITLLTDGGRCTRPLYIVKDDRLLAKKEHFTGAKDNTFTWDEFLGGFEKRTDKLNIYNCEYTSPPAGAAAGSVAADKGGIIEFLDTDESNSSYIAHGLTNLANDTGYTHMEIHPSIMLGFLGYNIPYSNCSQAPRNVYGTGQAKQTVGMYASNFRNRFDIAAHVLSYPQRPLINTRIAKYSMANTLPTGINAIVAIGCYTGYNQEDSIIINKTAVERGLFRSFYFKTYDATERYESKDDIEDIIANPTKVSEVDIRREYNYSKLNEEGTVNEGDYIEGNDVIIGKYTKNKGAYIDNSVAVKADGYGVVDKVFIDSMNTHNHRICKVRMCTSREPTLGDKFASRHGQKGVIGMVLRQEDMPFTKDGIAPDIIINPHAIPSRMTLGQFIECIQGKICCKMGFFADATPFTNIESEDVSDILEQKCGFMRHGDEILYGGILGNQMESKLFIGPTYYQRIKQMVKDKINVRNTGKYTLKNRQPPSGRAVGGGLRIGEMERDAILAHGTTAFLKESLIDRSDSYDYHISDMSGMVAVGNNTTNRFICPSNDGPLKFTDDEYMEDVRLDMNNTEQAKIVPIRVPYSTKLLTQECESMGICLRMIPRDDAVHAAIEVEPSEFRPQMKPDQPKRASSKKRPSVSSLELPKDTASSTALTMPKFKMKLDKILNGSEVADFIKSMRGTATNILDDIYFKYKEQMLYLKKKDANSYIINFDTTQNNFITNEEYKRATSISLVDDIQKLNIGDIVDLTSLLYYIEPNYSYGHGAVADPLPNTSTYIVPDSPKYVVPDSPGYTVTSPSAPSFATDIPPSPIFALNSPDFHPWDSWPPTPKDTNMPPASVFTFDPVDSEKASEKASVKPSVKEADKDSDKDSVKESVDTEFKLAPVPAKSSVIAKYGIPFVKPAPSLAPVEFDGEEAFPEDLKLQEVSFEELMKK
jgi:DNA-directed RNA polymerase II subunit RPB2